MRCRMRTCCATVCLGRCALAVASLVSQPAYEMRALLQPGEGVGARQALAALDTLAAKQGAEAPELPDKPLRTLEESLKQKLAEFREAPEDPPVVEEKRHVPIYVKFSSGQAASSSSPLPRRPMAKARLEPPSTEAAVQPESFALPSSAIAAESEPAEASESFALAPAAPEPEPAVEPEALQNFMRNVGKVLLNLGEYELLECEFAHQEGACRSPLSLTTSSGGRIARRSRVADSPAPAPAEVPDTTPADPGPEFSTLLDAGHLDKAWTYLSDWAERALGISCPPCPRSAAWLPAPSHSLWHTRCFWPRACPFECPSPALPSPLPT